MRRRPPGDRLRTLSGVALLLAASGLGAAGPENGEPWTEKVHPRVLRETERGPAEFIIYMDEQADLRSAGLETKLERGRRVFESLRDVATRTQAPLIALLEARGLEHRPFWIANMIWARGDRDAVETLARRAEVRRLDANPSVLLQPPVVQSGGGSAAAGSVEWGVAKVGADQVWSLGYLGADVVIGGQDTGYDWSHPALIGHYRGWDGATADHAYHWHDAIHGGGGICGADSPEPCDDHSHGTHTMGTMVGDDGGTNRIGVSPGATWIGCRNMDQGNGTPATYSECFEWFVAPTDLDGQNPDPAKAPHVINNSWTCPPSEGCSADTLQTVVENTRAAGIVVVVSAGNSGSSCSTVQTPPAIYEASFSVGATDSADNIASFSSRGPVTVDGSDRLKPDLSAPGVSVRSSVPNGGYSFFSGTSMAGPHVAGAVALLLDARPDLVGRVEEIETILARSALPLTWGQDCGGFSGLEIPNAVFGFGRLDALETLVGDADGDGTANLGDCRPTDATTWTAPAPVDDLRLGKDGTIQISWTEPVEVGAAAPTYDVLRSAAPDDFSAASCLATQVAGTSSADADPPEGLAFYLVRIRNPCGGAVGNRSGGIPRSVHACLSPGG